jgi:hypothetical protein
LKYLSNIPFDDKIYSFQRIFAINNYRCFSLKFDKSPPQKSPTPKSLPSPIEDFALPRRTNRTRKVKVRMRKRRLSRASSSDNESEVEWRPHMEEDDAGGSTEDAADDEEAEWQPDADVSASDGASDDEEDAQGLNFTIMLLDVSLQHSHILG